MKKFVFLVFILLGLGIMTGGYLYYFSPMTRLELYGVRLYHRIALKSPATFLFGWESVLQSRTEQNGRMDTPLANNTVNEVSTLFVERQSADPTHDTLRILAKEWIRSIKNGTEYKNQTFPLNHPSIAEGQVLLDKQGTMIERRGDDQPVPLSFWRMSRAIQFLFPTFPKGSLRVGATWTDHAQWTDVMDEWTLQWRADLRWAMKGFETRYGMPCARLVYEATLTPHMLKEPAWVGGAGQEIQHVVKGSGEVLYNIKDKQLLSNTFDYDGTIRIPIPRVEAVPEELRVGDVLSQGSGEVVFSFKNKIDIRLP